MNFIFRIIDRYISSHEERARIFSNVFWLILDKFLRLSMGLLVSIMLARYLGPEQFGQYNYVVVFVGLFGAIAVLGLNGIVIKRIVREPGKSASVLASAFFLQITGGVLATFLVISIVFKLSPDDDVIKTMISVYGFSLLFKFGDIFKYWFESNVQSRYTVWVENSIYIFFGLIKIAMILFQMPLLAFVWVLLLESFLVLIGLWLVFLKKGGQIDLFCINRQDLITLLKESLPLVFMSVMLGIYTKIDLIMVEYFLGWKPAGIYAATITLAESWFFFAVIFVQSLYPHLIKEEQNNKTIFNQKLTVFYSFMFWFAVFMASGLYVVSDYVVIPLFGQKYMDVLEVFQIYVWAGIFVFVITSSSRWFLLKNKNMSLMWRAVLGAIMNIVLNILWIEDFGLKGAVYATLVSYFFVAYVYDFLDQGVRKQLKYKFSGIYYPFYWLWTQIK